MRSRTTAIIKGDLRTRCYFVKAGADSSEHDSWCRGFGGRRQSVGSDQLNISTVLGGGEYNIASKKFRGGNITTVLGGCEVDLRDAAIAGESDQVVLDIFVLWGAIELRVPADWQVVMQTSPILGSVEDKTTPPQKAGKKLIIRGSTIMGALEVKN